MPDEPDERMPKGGRGFGWESDACSLRWDKDKDKSKPFRSLGVPGGVRKGPERERGLSLELATAGLRMRDRDLCENR